MHHGRVRILDRWAARSAARLGAAQVFRPPVGVVVSLLWAVVTVLWLVSAARAGVGPLLRQVPALVLVGTLVHATCTRPLVAVGPTGVLLRNVVRDVWVPWAALDGIDTRYALTLTAGGRRFAAWAAPASSRFSTARATPSDLKSVHWAAADGPIPASATLRSDSGAAAALIRRFWTPGGDPAAPGRSVRHDPVTPEPAGLDPAGPDRVEIRWDTTVLAVLAVSAAATVLVALLG